MSLQEMKKLYRSGQEDLNQNRLGAALETAEKMIRINPRDHNGWILRARVQISRGFTHEAISDLETAVKLQPKWAKVHLAAGNGYQTIGDHFKAIAAYDRALRLEPEMPLALAGKAKSYEMQGNTKRAMKTLRRYVEGDSPLVEAASVYLRLLIRDKKFDEAIDLGERVMATNPPDDKPKRDLCFAVASACEKSGRYEEAMRWGEVANDLLRVPFDRERFTAFIDELLSTFTKERLNAIPRATSIDTSLPVFIIGRPRSGSTLTERILDAHPDVHGAGEIATFHLMVMQMGMRISSPLVYPQTIQHLQQHVVDAESLAYMESVTPPDRAVSRVVDKHLGNYMHLPIMHVYFPQCHVLHTHRHPMDTCVSCYFERLQSTHLPWASSFDDLAFTYGEYLRVMNHFREIIDIPLLDVAYEDLVADQATMSRKIIDFCGLPWDDACIDFHKTARTDRTLSYEQVRQPIYHTAMGRAERFGNLLDPLREALERYGVPVPERADSPDAATPGEK